MRERANTQCSDVAQTLGTDDKREPTRRRAAGLTPLVSAPATPRARDQTERGAAFLRTFGSIVASNIFPSPAAGFLPSSLWYLSLISDQNGSTEMRRLRSRSLSSARKPTGGGPGPSHSHSEASGFDASRSRPSHAYSQQRALTAPAS